MEEKISITAIASISPLGETLEETWSSYTHQHHCFQTETFNEIALPVGSLSSKAKDNIATLRQSDAKYHTLDESVLYAILASRNAIVQAGWSATDNFGINIGSSRGATGLFEKYHAQFLAGEKTATLVSPTTTLGNISSWVGHDLQTQGPQISHSITCSTALHSLLNGVAWIKSGMANKFLVGGSEAPLTPFTIAQMKALKIYARPNATISLEDAATRDTHFKNKYPCQALNLTKTQNSMVLGEAASMACLEIGTVPNALAFIEGVGYATEPLEHNVSISTDALCFQRSMKMALKNTLLQEVDVIVMHAPGTIKGDLSEYNAIHKVFGDAPPSMTTNKWKVGHTFGASGMLNIELAILMLQKQEFIKVPFTRHKTIPKKINKILVNAVGFGGNAVSVVLSL